MKTTIVLIQLVIILMFPIFAFRHSLPYLKPHRFLGALTAARYAQVAPDRKVLVLVAKGSEEIETVTIIDTLVRGGASVVLAAVGSPSLQIRCSRGVNVVADKHIRDCVSTEWDMVVCPGGMPGAQYLSECLHVKEILNAQNGAGKYIAAICAAPAVVLAVNGICKASQMTCYPTPQFIHQLGEKYVNERVVVDGNVITSQGPGTALEFSLALVKTLFGEDKAAKVKNEMIF